jgi:hypothetical protein
MKREAEEYDSTREERRKGKEEPQEERLPPILHSSRSSLSHLLSPLTDVFIREDRKLSLKREDAPGPSSRNTSDSAPSDGEGEEKVEKKEKANFSTSGRLTRDSNTLNGMRLTMCCVIHTNSYTLTLTLTLTLTSH